MPDGHDIERVVSGAGPPDTGARPALRRALGQRDLVLLFVVAVLNLNSISVIASNGPITVWMWLLALCLFFLPQGLAVIELAQRYPHEGGVYLWTKKVFGDFHGFMSGWCYWTNNVFYIPTLLLYVVGISVFVGGAEVQALGDNKVYVSVVAVSVLWVMTGINVAGLQIGKWVNNVGAVGTAVGAAVLIGLAVAVALRHGVLLRASDFRVRNISWGLMGTFGIVCFSCVGLELASVMGDEIQEPHRTLPRAVALGGTIVGSLCVLATLAVLIAMPAKDIGAVQGIVQAIGRLAATMGIAWLVPPVALVLTVSIAGATSAWLAGSARIPFVAGLDHYLPSVLGRLHHRFATPYVALLVQGAVSCLVLAMSFFGSTVQEGYRILLLLAVVLQLIPFLYMFLALIRLALAPDFRPARYPRATLLAVGATGAVVTAFGTVLAFAPQGSGPVWLFETKMVLGTLVFLGLGVFFYVTGRRRTAARYVMS